MAKVPLVLPRLPSNWADQPALFSRMWNEAMSKIEENIVMINENIQQINQLLIDVGIAQETADGGLELAQSAIKPGGMIKDDKVATPAITSNAVNKPYFTQTSSDITLPDGVDTVVCTITTTKDVADSDMEISSIVRLDSSDDLRGTFTIVRDSTVIDTLDIFNNGAGGTNRLPFPILFRDFDASLGVHTYSVNFKRDGGASTLKAKANSNLSVVEVKR